MKSELNLINFFWGIRLGESLGEKKFIMIYHLPFDIPQSEMKYIAMSNARMLVEEAERLQHQNFFGTLITTKKPESFHWMPYSNLWMEGLKDLDFENKSIEEITDELFGSEG